MFNFSVPRAVVDFKFFFMRTNHVLQEVIMTTCSHEAQKFLHGPNLISPLLDLILKTHQALPYEKGSSRNNLKIIYSPAPIFYYRSELLILFHIVIFCRKTLRFWNLPRAIMLVYPASLRRGLLDSLVNIAYTCLIILREGQLILVASQPHKVPPPLNI